MSSLFSMMRNDFMPASRSLMAIQRPEKPAPTMRTSTFVTEDSAKEAADSVMRVSSLPCWDPQAQRGRGGTRHFLATVGEVRESGGGRVARHAGQPAGFSAVTERRPGRHLRPGPDRQLDGLRQ